MSLSVTVIPVSALQENCSLLVCDATRKAAFVDPGGEPDRLVAALKNAGATLERILITHAHADHVAGVTALKDRFQSPVEGPHKDDAPLLENFLTQKSWLGLPDGDVFTPDRWLVHGDRVTVGEETLDVLHVPGHSPGSVAFFHEPSRLAFVGDVLFAGSIGRTDLPGGNYATLMASIKDRLLPLGDDVAFIPGHGPESTFGRERQVNPYLRR